MKMLGIKYFEISTMEIGINKVVLINNVIFYKIIFDRHLAKVELSSNACPLQLFLILINYL